MIESLMCDFSVADAKAVVVGPTDIYVKMGSEVILTCIVSQGPHELGTIYWYRGEHSNCSCFAHQKFIGSNNSIGCFCSAHDCQLDTTRLDVPPEFESNDINYSPRITVDTKWTDALRSR